MVLPLISIIIVNWNGRRHIERCLSSIEKNSYPCNRYEVLFIDNCSTDGSADFVRTNYPWVKVIVFKKNYGFAEANNLSLKSAVGEYLVFLNNDTKVTADWLLKLVEASQTHGAHICCSKTLVLSNPELIHYSGAKLVINGRGNSTAFLMKKALIRNEAFYTGYPCATSMLIKKSVFEKIGGFDPDYFAGLDDTDLGWRAWLLGYSVLCCPSSVVYHAVGGTTGGMNLLSPIRVYQGTKNALMNIIKNLEFKNLTMAFSLAFGFDLADFLLLLSRKDITCCKNKIASYFWVLNHIPLLISKRRSVQSKRKTSDKWLIDHQLLSPLSDAIHQYFRLREINQNCSR
jgi:GT2 family glycosyltransferase